MLTEGGHFSTEERPLREGGVRFTMRRTGASYGFEMSGLGKTVTLCPRVGNFQAGKRRSLVWKKGGNTNYRKGNGGGVSRER